MKKERWAEKEMKDKNYDEIVVRKKDYILGKGEFLVDADSPQSKDFEVFYKGKKINVVVALILTSYGEESWNLK